MHMYCLLSACVWSVFDDFYLYFMPEFLSVKQSKVLLYKSSVQLMFSPTNRSTFVLCVRTLSKTVWEWRESLEILFKSECHLFELFKAAEKTLKCFVLWFYEGCWRQMKVEKVQKDMWYVCQSCSCFINSIAEIVTVISMKYNTTEIWWYPFHSQYKVPPMWEMQYVQVVTVLL